MLFETGVPPRTLRPLHGIDCAAKGKNRPGLYGVARKGKEGEGRETNAGMHTACPLSAYFTSRLPDGNSLSQSLNQQVIQTKLPRNSA